jgi:hypothetical protein
LKISILVILLFALLAVFLYTKSCENRSCFNSYLSKCDKARYISNEPDSVWSYKIEGISNDKCIVTSELISVKEGSSDLQGLEGNDMTCELTTGEITDPKSDLKKCHGALKEKIQEIMIQKMHAYILENIGKISEEFQGI